MLFITLDLISTAIGLSIPGIFETNPIGAWFFTFGLIGWIGCVIFMGMWVYFIFSFCDVVNHFIYEHSNGKKMPESLSTFLYGILASGFCLISLSAIINNLSIIIKFG